MATTEATLSTPGSGSPTAAAADSTLARRYMAVRAFTEHLVEGLAPEDMVVQSMPDVSPTKWHLAHTSWFFERFVLMEHARGYTPLHDTYLYLFNSYYQQAGERHCRDQRGYISRPTVAEVLAYRRHVDEAMVRLLQGLDEVAQTSLVQLVTLGLNHEQQHQELMLTDIKHVFSVNPLRPVYRTIPGRQEPHATRPLQWVSFDADVYETGHQGDDFAYDNEEPRHREFVEAFALADRLVTNGEYLDFMRDGGYQRPELWLSLGWATVQQHGWAEPFYWERHGDTWMTFTLSGMREVNADEPVCHLSYFEADAFARGAGARLPTEAEWEVAAATVAVAGNFVDDGHHHPGVASPAAGLRQMYGDVWEWTSSSYAPYPGFRTAPGAVGEYNGKFMCNQYVLRGGSCATSRSHIRPTYRNFFPPEATWQFTGVRLARDVESGGAR
ncbi:MAG TPA: ergothioneine biosynthesis protein EgtB [Longimicrobiales bacterium]|nr:ergothioneine biosynthesis protein EgtB [Longimicrobiales bacterium]